MNVLRQLVKVKVDVNGEWELHEYPIDELKFKPKRRKVKVSADEIKKLSKLEDKGGNSKLDDSK